MTQYGERPGFSFGGVDIGEANYDRNQAANQYNRTMGSIYGPGMSQANYQNLAVQDALWKQEKEKQLFAQGLQNNQGTLSHQRAMELARLKQQPLNQLTAAWGQSQGGGSNSLAAMMEAYKGMFGGGGQPQMQGNWNSLSQMLRGR